jgi:acetyl esterase/lipase
LPNLNSIKVRLLNHENLDIKNNSKVYDTILIHFHGGGFIALSSCTSQTYTRKWAKSLKLPVFSVDYGKPPEFKFPIPVLDCL